MKHNLDNITSQKWGARHICEPHDHKSGGLEPLGPIGVYAYASTMHTKVSQRQIRTLVVYNRSCTFLLPFLGIFTNLEVQERRFLTSQATLTLQTSYLNVSNACVTTEIAAQARINISDFPVLSVVVVGSMHRRVTKLISTSALSYRSISCYMSQRAK